MHYLLFCIIRDIRLSALSSVSSTCRSNYLHIFKTAIVNDECVLYTRIALHHLHVNDLVVELVLNLISVANNSKKDKCRYYNLKICTKAYKFSRIANVIIIKLNFSLLLINTQCMVAQIRETNIF